MTAADRGPEAVAEGPVGSFGLAGLSAIGDDRVQWAIRFIDRSGLTEQVAIWKAEDSRGPGGRPETFPMRALLVAMVLCATTNEPLLVTSFRDVLFSRISPAMRTSLGVPSPPGALDARGWEAVYRNLRTRFHGLLDLMDPSPLPKNRRMANDQFLVALRLNRSRLTDEDWSEREQRLEWFVNRVLEASLKTLPREVRRRWKGSVAVDATVVPAFARPERAAPRVRKAKPREVITHSADPDAAWYIRTEADDPDDRGGFSARNTWGYEATFAVSGSDRPDQAQSFPSVVVGMAPLHKPGHNVGSNATRALRSVYDRGQPANFLAADRAYTNAKPDDFKLPVRALGYKPVLDYKIDQLGVQASFGGMLQIEGAWYCPSIPDVLMSATADFRAGRIDEATYEARLKERRGYLIRQKAGADEEGHLRVRCPASNPKPVARCDLKPASVRPETRGRLRVNVRPDVEQHPPSICRQQSLTLPPEAGAKFAQDLLYGSHEWHATYATLRNSIEGFNGYVKDGAREALDDPERRPRPRGRRPERLRCPSAHSCQPAQDRDLRPRASRHRGGHTSTPS